VGTTKREVGRVSQAGKVAQARKDAAKRGGDGFAKKPFRPVKKGCVLCYGKSRSFCWRPRHCASRHQGSRQSRKPNLARCLRAIGSIQQRKALPDVFDQHDPELLQRLAGTRRRVAGDPDFDVDCSRL
jgi:hypothetical protein